MEIIHSLHQRNRLSFMNFNDVSFDDEQMIVSEGKDQGGFYSNVAPGTDTPCH